MTSKSFLLWIIAFIFLPFGGGVGGNQSQDLTNQSKDLTNQGYTCTVGYDNNTFLAAGTNGRLDKIGKDKQVQNIPLSTNEDLLKIFINKEVTMICGTGGTILSGINGENFKTLNTGVSSTIYNITLFNGIYYACSDKGVILKSNDGVAWEQIKIDVTTDIISISSNSNLIMAITNQTDIITSSDGVNWKVENFNKAYDGYYEPYTFTSIRCMGESFYVVGHVLEDPGVPYVMVSNTGEVWLPRSLDIIEGIDYENPLSLKINAIGYDLDQILAVCDGGRILTISDCYKCNKVEKFAEVDLNDLALEGDKLIIVGDNYVFDILDTSATRQYKIKAEQAYDDLKSGAVIIDVRTDEEYNQGHILGCIHIPVNEIEQRLPDIVPNRDTKIIFYCGGGGRAQTALETALDLGYQRVYNLGGFSDWPYETE